MADKLTPFEGGGEPSEMAEAIRSLTQYTKEHLELAKFTAAVKREYYLELIEQGFTKSEALELTKAHKLGG